MFLELRAGLRVRHPFSVPNVLGLKFLCASLTSFPGCLCGMETALERQNTPLWKSSKRNGAALYSLLCCCENVLRGYNGGLLIVISDGASNPWMY